MDDIDIHSFVVYFFKLTLMEDNMDFLTIDDVLKRLSDKCSEFAADKHKLKHKNRDTTYDEYHRTAYGGQGRFAEHYGINKQALTDVICRRKPPPKSILDILNLEKIVHYSNNGTFTYYITANDHVSE